MAVDKNLLPVFRTTYKWRKTIIGITVVAVVLSLIIALVLPVYYKADTVFFAASPDLGKPEKIFGLSNSEMQYYGTDDDVDRILSMSSSSALLDYLIDSFELMSYYDVRPDKQAARTITQRSLKDDLTIMKDEEGAIRLSMVHKDPEKAAEIALAARDYIENNILQLLKEGQGRVIQTFESSIAEKQARLGGLADTLNYIRENFGIIDPSSQAEVLATLLASTESNLSESKARLRSMKNSRLISRDTIALITAKVEGLEEKMKSLTDLEGSQYANIKKYNEGLNDYLYYNQLYSIIKNDLANENRRLQYYQSAMLSSPPGIHVIEEVQVPEKKFKPVRSLVVIIGTMGAFIFSILVILLIESFRKFPWERVKDVSH